MQPRIFITIALLFFATASATAQPTLFDEFGKVPLGELAARVDNMMTHVERNGGRIVVALAAPPDSPFARKLQEMNMRHLFESRRYDAELVTFVPVVLPYPGNWIQVWHVPKDSPPPQLTVIAEDLRIDPVRKPLLVISSCGPCEYLGGPVDQRYYLPWLRDLLKANAWADLRVVIGTGSMDKFRQLALTYDKLLTENEGIERRRLRFIRSRKLDDDRFFLVTRRGQKRRILDMK